MPSTKTMLRFLNRDWATPTRQFGLLLSLACLSLPACESSKQNGEEEESSQEGSEEGSENNSEDEPEDSEEDEPEDSEEDEPEDSEEDEPEESEESEEDEPEESEEDEPEGSGEEEPKKSGESKRDCEQIKWGKKGVKEGNVVARGDVQGFADSNDDFKPEKKEVDAGMCELHLSKYRCAMVVYGAG